MALRPRSSALVCRSMGSYGTYAAATHKNATSELMRLSFVKRLTAPLGHRHRGKLSVLSQTLCSVDQLKPAELVSPYETNWYPPPSKSDIVDTTFRSRRAGHPMIACTMIPNDFNTSPVQGEQIDEWDFVLRNAFVLASSPIKKALRSVHLLRLCCVRACVCKLITESWARS